MRNNRTREKWIFKYFLGNSLAGHTPCRRDALAPPQQMSVTAVHPVRHQFRWPNWLTVRCTSFAVMVPCVYSVGVSRNVWRLPRRIRAGKWKFEAYQAVRWCLMVLILGGLPGSRIPVLEMSPRELCVCLAMSRSLVGGCENSSKFCDLCRAKWPNDGILWDFVALYDRTRNVIGSFSGISSDFIMMLNLFRMNIWKIYISSFPQHNKSHIS